MERMEAIQWMLSVKIRLRLSQSKKLGELAAALRAERVCPAIIGLALALTTTAKHAIKRVWRFFPSNPRIEVADAMRGVIERLFRDAKSRRNEPALRSILTEALIGWIESCSSLLKRTSSYVPSASGPSKSLALAGGIPTTVTRNSVSSSSEMP